MIFKLAFENIVGNGWRSLINVFILAIVLIGLVWGEGMWYSWLHLAKTQQKQWEFASGIMRAKSYDPFDTFSWEKGYAPIPAAAQDHVRAGKIVPILFSPGVIYPQGRMMNAVVKGIPRHQNLIRIPSNALRDGGNGYVPAIIGKAMARSTRLKVGDTFTLRIKNSEDTQDALDLQVAEIMDCPVPSLDIGTVWVDLDSLLTIKQLQPVATVLVLQDASLGQIPAPAFRVIPEKEFFADLDQMVKTKVSGQSMPFAMLIFLAMLAIFDTQALAIFKRRKEIGMLSALGMTKGQIVRLFTTEGALYMVFAALACGILGFPLFYYFAAHGFSLPKGYDSFGVAGFDAPLKFRYPLPIVAVTFIFLLLLTILVSWLPARRIAKMKPTEALRGK